MKNLAAREQVGNFYLPLSELEFHCKKLVFDMGKASGSKNLLAAFFICNPPLLHGRSYVKSKKVSRRSCIMDVSFAHCVSGL